MPTWGHGMSGAPERALAKARSRSFPFQFKPNGNQYLSLTGGPGVYIAFFGTGFAAVLSPILCTVRFYVLRPVIRPPESGSPGTARTQRPGRSRSPVGSTILIITARGVSRCPGRTHVTVEVAPDNLPLVPGWSAPVRAEKRLRMIHRGASF